jgi:hypothetical protein
MDRTFSSDAAQTALDAPSDRALRVPFYCEENVWRLAHRLHSTTTNCHVVFISNARQCVAMYHQLACEDGPCLWDYHVVLIKTENSEPVVLDMDSRLSYPCPLEEYQQSSFVQEGDYAPLFRYVQAEVLCSRLVSSDSLCKEWWKRQCTWNTFPAIEVICTIRTLANGTLRLQITHV